MVRVPLRQVSSAPTASRSVSQIAIAAQTSVQKASIVAVRRAGSQPVKLSTRMLARITVP
jgi:hypothetical protein